MIQFFPTSPFSSPAILTSIYHPSSKQAFFLCYNYAKRTVFALNLALDCCDSRFSPHVGLSLPVTSWLRLFLTPHSKLAPPILPLSLYHISFSLCFLFVAPSFHPSKMQTLNNAGAFSVLFVILSPVPGTHSPLTIIY